MLFVEVVIYSEKSFLTTLPVFAERSHHPPLLKEGRFVVCLICFFTAEKRIKQFAYSISQSAALTALFTKERADYNNKCNSKKIDFISTEV